MSRLFVHVEGQTEEDFVNEVLRSHLVSGHNYHQVTARLMGNARLRAKRGGVQAWQPVKKEILSRLKEDKGRFVTTLVDYYALPQGDEHAGHGWPGRANAGQAIFEQKGAIVQRALRASIAAELPDPRDYRRFIPFVMMHEFEALLFSNCAAFADGVGAPVLAGPLQAIADQFTTPEEINDSPHTAPSKRVLALFEQHKLGKYEKPLHGNLAALGIGLPTIRARCPHFNAWMTLLESLT